ncbi:MAG: PBP1A family penicillin-binding protein [Nitrospinae bacterium]|nr:PBP1A family penicillin-binding protein [Nitrospinota bacterium]
MQFLKPFIKIISLLSLLVIFISIIAGIGIYYKFSRNLPDIRSLKSYKPSLITKVYSDTDELIAEFYVEKRILVSLGRIPSYLKNATIAVEDANFFKHNGLDFGGLLRAFLINLKAGKVVEGGSTITQQIAKTMFLTSERTLYRKIREAILAYRIEKEFSKEEILELYLNQIYYGHGAYGVEAAAEIYFGKHVEDLNLPESALIAGLPRAPAAYSPYFALDRTIDRLRHSLGRMVEEGYITHEEEKNAIETELKFEERRKKKNDAPYFVEYVRQYLEDKFGSTILYHGGLKVYTTVNMEFQRAAQEAIIEGLRQADKRYGYRGAIGNIKIENKGRVDWNGLRDTGTFKDEDDPLNLGDIRKGVVIKLNPTNVVVSLGTKKGIIDIKDMAWVRKPDPSIDGRKAGSINSPSDVLNLWDIIEVKILELNEENDSDTSGLSGEYIRLALEQEPLVQGALICIDPKTGYIKAMVGGYDFSKSQFNRAIQAIRQPGSAFKPIIYSAAIEKGYTTIDKIIDSPIIYSKWKPVNFEERFYGPTTLRTALIYSRNIATIKLLEDIGVNEVVDYAKKIGIKSPITPALSMALGSSSVNLLELISAYGIFANRGIRAEPIGVKGIIDREGNILEENKPITEKVISEEVAYITTDLLQDVVNYGTGKGVRSLNRPVAGKTGTTNNFVDAWFIGYTPDIVAGVWIGMDQDIPLGKNETGSRVASPIWLQFMKKILNDTPITDFYIPPNIVFSKIDPRTGLLATSGTKGAVFECFIEGTEPTGYSSPQEITTTDFFRKDLDGE